MELNKTQKLICFLIEKCEGIDDKVKLAKLQYFVDFIHYAFNDAPISEVDVVYDRQKFGPLSVSFNRDLNALKKAGHIEEKPQYNFVMKKPCNAEFTETELKTINFVLQKYGNLSFNELAQISHDQMPYQTAQEGGIVQLFTAYNLVDEYPDYPA